MKRRLRPSAALPTASPSRCLAKLTSTANIARRSIKGRAPLYVDDILWNFEKFLVDRQGNVIQRFSPDMTPDDPQLVAAIKGALAQ